MKREAKKDTNKNGAEKEKKKKPAKKETKKKATKRAGKKGKAAKEDDESKLIKLAEVAEKVQPHVIEIADEHQPLSLVKEKNKKVKLRRTVTYALLEEKGVIELIRAMLDLSDHDIK